MPIDGADATHVRDLLDQQKYPEAYRYMAEEIRADPNWNQGLADWAEQAAEINGPESNFWKDWVFTFNAHAAGKPLSDPDTLTWNQDFSNQLAIDALNDFAQAADAGIPLPASKIFERDVIEAVDGLGNPDWAWAGGPLGILQFGFPMSPAYDTAAEWRSWLANALSTLGTLPDWYVAYATEFVADTINEFGEFLTNINEIYDPKKLLDELTDLLRHFRSDPLVIDLDGDGIILRALDGNNTRFDIDGDGAIERVGWVGPNDGLLVFDANQNGAVDGVNELIGNTHIDGFDEFATLDTNTDGLIGQQDLDFSKIFIWRDTNGDGISSSGELLTTVQAGISSFNLSYTNSGIEMGGSLIARIGSYALTAGGQRAIASVQFATDETVARLTLPVGANLGVIATLPNLGGYGSVADLRTSMFHDAALEAMVSELVSGDHDFDTFEDFLRGGFLDILYRWAGVDLDTPGETDSSLREKLIEALTGESLFDLSAGQRDRIENVWDSIIGRLGVGFLVQSASRTRDQLILDLGDQLSGLDSEDQNYFDEVRILAQVTLNDIEDIDLPYSYLEKFSSLSLDPDTGMVVGDFDTFARDFIKDQPSFSVFISASTAGGGAPATPQSHLNSFTIGSIIVEDEEPEPQHPWLAWYEKEGALLFNVAAAMGIGAEYVKNVTGWQWIMKRQADVLGTSADEALNETVSTVTYTSINSAPDGGTLYSSQTAQTRDQRLYGFEGNDELRGNDGVDTLIGGTGNDLLFGGSDSDMYVYSAEDGLDRVTEESGEDDAIFFSEELKQEDLQVIRPSGTNDLQLHFGDVSKGIILTNQINLGGFGIERFSFVGVGPVDAGDIATIYLRSFSSEYTDTIIGTAAGEDIFGLAGNDTLSGLSGDDLISGGSGDDNLSGGNGNDRLEGGADNDLIFGGDGNAILTGGTGNDTLSGFHGDDTYVFNSGDGQDIITDDGWGDDTIQLGAGILTSDVTIYQADNGNDLVLAFAGSTDRIVINDTMTNGQRRIERVTFANGTVWSHADLVARSVLNNADDNIFYGSFDSEALAGGAGNDTLVGRDGNDIITGGTANDTLYGNHGDDTYVFNSGDGQDIITDDGWGDDTIQLGAGILTSDVTIYQADNGNDLVLTFAGSTDRIVINDTMTNGQRRIERVTFANGTVWSHADLVARSVLNNADDNIFYGSFDSEALAGGAGNDTLVGRDGNDIITGGTANDTLYGNHGDDTYVFNSGDGQDIITDDGWGDDTIQLGAGILTSDVTIYQADNGNDLVLTFAGSTDRIVINDTMTNGQRRIERVTFANGTVWSHADLVTLISASSPDLIVTGTASIDTLVGEAANDRLNGGAGEDILKGGAGNDYLSGGDHGDTYVFNSGSGQDFVSDGGQGGEDVIQFGTGILPSDITVVQADNGNDLILLIAGTNDRITLDNSMHDWWGRIEKVTFAEGTVWTHADLVTRSMLNNAGDNVFSGSSDEDTLSGGAGNDILSGRSSSDILLGGTGNDYLSGGDHGDTYVFNSGSGQDFVSDGGQGGEDVIQFGTGILPSDITVVQADNGNDLILLIAGTNDRITLDNSMHDWWGRIEKVTFAEGTVWTHADLVTRSMLNNAGDNVFSGSSDEDTLSGGAGNDILSGRSSSDILLGGTGNDYLSGGDHGDTYVFNSGSGQDFVSDGGQGGEDVIQFGTGILPSDITVVQADNGNDLILLIAGTNDRITLDNTVNDWWGRIEKVTFAEGTVWTFADLMARSTLGTPGADVLSGYDGSDRIFGADGNDALYGNDGDDTLIGGSGNDSLDGGAGIDTADYSYSSAALNINLGMTTAQTVAAGDVDTITNIENLIGGSGDDVLAGNTLGNILEGRGGNDTLGGNSGNDILLGGDGDDRLSGGNGSDILDGGAGIDTASYTSGTVAQTINLSIATAQTISSGNVDTILNMENVTGGTGADTITGNALANVLNGASGDDIVNGGDGDDTLIGGSGNDVLNGDAGIDTVDYSSASVAQTIDLTSTSQQIISAGNADTLSNIENVLGGTVADTILGNSSANMLHGGAGDDTLNGGDGDDSLIGGSGNDSLDGGAGIDTADYSYSSVALNINLGMTTAQTVAAGDVDTITNIENLIGGSGDDTLAGNTLGNILEGRGGNDTLGGNSGNDILLGGDGDDRLSGGNGSDILDGGAGIDTASYTSGTVAQTINLSITTAQTISSGNVDTILNMENVTGGTGADTITGNALANVLNGASGDDIVNGGDGDDTLIGGSGNDVLNGGAGIDTVDYSSASVAQTIDLTSTSQQIISAGNADTLSNIENVLGGTVADTILGNSSANMLHGGAGDDTLNGGDGDDSLIGGSGNDSLDGGAGIDTVDYSYSSAALNINLGMTTAQTVAAGDVDTITNIENLIGGSGDDVLAGNTLGNILEGRGGNDTLGGNSGNDILLGGDGDDRLSGGNGSDILDGGAGIDTASYTSGTVAQTINLSIATAQTISSGNVDTILNMENVTGGTGADTITGNALANVLNGASGDDIVNGGDGDDTLIGGSGNDVLNGGAGNDSLNGDAGTSDIAVFAGGQASYTISTNGGILTITDNQPNVDGDDGADTITGVEHLQFTDGTVSLAAPIILDLDGNGVSLIARNQSQTNFDWNADGVVDRTGWVGGNDGFLYFDRNGDGSVSGAEELSFTQDKAEAKSDLDGLTAFDTNGDGMFSINDECWTAFGVWQDKNGNGSAETNELLSMDEASLESISFEATATNQIWSWDDNIVFNQGSFAWSDGRSGTFVDVALNYVALPVMEDSAARVAASQLIDAMTRFGSSRADSFRWESRTDHHVRDFCFGDRRLMAEE